MHTHKQVIDLHTFLVQAEDYVGEELIPESMTFDPEFSDYIYDLIKEDAQYTLEDLSKNLNENLANHASKILEELNERF